MAQARDRYADVGVAMREAIRLAIAAKLNLTEHRLFLAVLDQTASWSRGAEAVALSTLAEIAGIPRRKAERALSELRAAGVVERSGNGGRGRPATLSLPGFGPKDRPLMAGVSLEKHRPEPTRNTGLIHLETPASRGRTPEKVREDEGQCFIDNCPEPARYVVKGLLWCERHGLEEAAA